MSIPEFEAILDQASKDVGDSKVLFAEVYLLQENFQKSGRDIRLQELIMYAKEFEATQHRRKSSIDPTMASIAAMGMPLSRQQRRAQERKKSGSFATKKKRKK